MCRPDLVVVSADRQLIQLERSWSIGKEKHLRHVQRPRCYNLLVMPCSCICLGGALDSRPLETRIETSIPGGWIPAQCDEPMLPNRRTPILCYD